MDILGIIALAVAASVPGGHPPHPPDPLAVIHHWDARRAAAYVAQSPARLRRLYEPASPARAADLAVLRAYGRHGVRVTAMTPQVFASRVLARDGSRIRVRLTGRVGATGMDRRRCRRLPTSPVSTRDLTLRRRHGRWVMVSVRALDPVVIPASRAGRLRAPQ